MTVRPIVIWPDPRLSQICAPITEITAEVHELATDMLETMYAAPGRGLAAPQVGVLQRMFVMDCTWKEGTRAPVICINPTLTEISDTQAIATEGCLSIPGITAEVRRPAEVTLTWLDLEGRENTERFDGFAAVCVQHELDHLDGRVTFDRLPKAARDSLVAEYQTP